MGCVWLAQFLNIVLKFSNRYNEVCKANKHVYVIAKIFITSWSWAVQSSAPVGISLA